MIPLRKLSELPRSQRLRKCAKIFEEAERRFVLSERLPAEEAEYLGNAAELLARDEDFSEAARAALEEAAALKRMAFNLAADSPAAGAPSPLIKAGAPEIRRALNTVYNILLAETGRNRADWDFIEASGALDPSKRRTFAGMRIYLEDIRSPFNVGAMFRSAESFGAEKIWLSPLCASPRHKRAERTAMGCVDILPWEYLDSDPFARDSAGLGLSAKGAPVESRAAVFTEHPAAVLPFSGGPFFALETGGTPLEDFSFPRRGILIAGSEELGVSPRALAAADASLGRVSIRTWGAKGSLNVSVAFGIVMRAWAERLAASSKPGEF